MTDSTPRRPPPLPVRRDEPERVYGEGVPDVPGQEHMTLTHLFAAAFLSAVSFAGGVAICCLLGCL